MKDMRVALIIGGGSGMGAEAARGLYKEGFEVGIMTSSGKGKPVAQELGGMAFVGSNRSNEDLQSFIHAAVEKWGRIDAVVSSAAHGPKGPILEITDAEWHAGMEIYLLNVIRVARAATPIMLKQNTGGSFVNISTFAAFEPDVLFPTSGVFRSGLASLAKLFANKYAKENIRMNNVLPGFIDSLPETEDRRARIPMGRYGRTEEVSELIAFLASEKSGYITGQNIRIDGGVTRSL